MSSAVAFRTPCPSCNAPIAIKSHDFVGKKVDCPKCKYRFVVPSPDEGKPKADETKGKKKKSNRDKVNEEIIKVSKKKGSKMPLLLAGAGAAVFIIVGVVLFIFIMGPEDKPLPVARGGGGGGGDAGVPAGRRGGLPGGGGGGAGDTVLQTNLTNILMKLANPQTRDAGIKELEELLKNASPADREVAAKMIEDATRSNPAAKAFLEQLAKDKSQPALASLATGVLERLGAGVGGGSTIASHAEPSNFLPNNTTTVFTLYASRLVSSVYQKAIITFGAFKYEDFESRLGINLSSLDQIIVGGNRDQGSILVVVRTSQDFSWDDVRQRLGISPDPQKTVKGKQYFLGKVDFLTEFLDKRLPAITSLKQKAAFHKVDDRTLVYADEETMKKWLDAPPVASKPMAPAAPSGGSTSIAPPQPGQAPQTNQPPPQGGGRSRGTLLGAGTGDDGNTQATVPARSSAPSGPSTTTIAKDEPYATLGAELRQLIKLVEAGQECVGLFVDTAGRGGRENLASNLLVFRDLPAPQQAQIIMLALAVPMAATEQDNLVLRGAFLCKDRREAETVRKEVAAALAAAAKRTLRQMLGAELVMNEDGAGSNVAGGSQVAPPSSFTPVTPQAPQGGGRGGSGPGAGGAGMGAGNLRLDPGSGGGGGGSGGGFSLGSQPQNPTTTPTDAGPPERSTISVSRQDEIILVTIDVNRKAVKNERFVENNLGWIMVERRADFEVGSGRIRVADLAGSLIAYRNGMSAQGQNFLTPMGALARRVESDRGRPFPPAERLSFFADLMPYFGERMVGVREGLNPNLSWRDPENVKYGRILVAELLTPGGGKTYTRVAGVDSQLAVTHFVGMGGVGPDAPYLPANHPLAGIFGYDRQTRPEDIRDGASNTIMMIQIDGNTAGPWIAGGGATIRGTSPNCDRDVGFPGGFRSPNYGGKEGVWVIMADGSTRFLNRNISPNVFKALCTMNGGDDAGDIDLAAPRQKLETYNTQTRPVGAPAAPTTTPRPRVREEEDEPAPAKPPKKP